MFNFCIAIDNCFQQDDLSVPNDVQQWTLHGRSVNCGHFFVLLIAKQGVKMFIAFVLRDP